HRFQFADVPTYRLAFHRLGQLMLPHEHRAEVVLPEQGGFLVALGAQQDLDPGMKERASPVDDKASDGMPIAQVTGLARTRPRLGFGRPVGLRLRSGRRGGPAAGIAGIRKRLGMGFGLGYRHDWKCKARTQSP
ncbi:MAG: hypothetical protein ACR2HW_06730, partial [Gemmatimonadales bacterium]